MVIVTNANAVSLKKGTGEKTLFKLSNTVTGNIFIIKYILS